MYQWDYDIFQRKNWTLELIGFLLIIQSTYFRVAAFSVSKKTESTFPDEKEKQWTSIGAAAQVTPKKLLPANGRHLGEGCMVATALYLVTPGQPQSRRQGQQCRHKITMCMISTL